MFRDRVDAGRRLADRLAHLRGEDLVVVGLPRGGVVVAAQVAEALGTPLDMILVRKLGLPYQPELAIGEGEVRIPNDGVLRIAGIEEEELAEVEERERAELEGRARRLRGDRPRISLRVRTALIVDDGIATGSTARAACRVVSAQGAARVIMAVIVSRGGRPDLAEPRLARVPAPTLLIVGGRDEALLEPNRRAQAQLDCESDPIVVPGAAHLFEEPGAPERVAELAGDWFRKHLVSLPVPTSSGKRRDGASRWRGASW